MLVASPVAIEAQERISLGRHRFMFPVGAEIDSSRALFVLEEVHSSTAVPGLPVGLLASQAITVTLASEIAADIDAVAYADQSVVAISARNWKEWPLEKLRRVVRHEVGHLALRSYLGGQSIPTWLSEGFAEWSAGGVTCEDEALIDLEVSENAGVSATEFLSAKNPQKLTRVEAARFRAFVEFLDRDGSVRSGRLLVALRRDGLVRAFERLYRATVESLVIRWWNDAVAHRSLRTAKLRSCS